MQLPYLFLVIYIIIVIVFLWMPKKGFDKVIRKYMDSDFKPEKKTFAYRGVQYYRIVILGAGIVAAILTLLMKVLFY
jgi:hypothetical protein